jgi:hypothetical protein
MAAAERRARGSGKLAMVRVARLALALLAAAPTGVSAWEGCDGELALDEIRLRQASAALSDTRDAPMAQRCVAFRDTVRVMQRASDTRRRCLSGSDARAALVDMDRAIARWRQTIARDCG